MTHKQTIEEIKRRLLNAGFEQEDVIAQIEACLCKLSVLKDELDSLEEDRDSWKTEAMLFPRDGYSPSF